MGLGRMLTSADKGEDGFHRMWIYAKRQSCQYVAVTELLNMNMYLNAIIY